MDYRFQPDLRAAIFSSLAKYGGNEPRFDFEACRDSSGQAEGDRRTWSKALSSFSNRWRDGRFVKWRGKSFLLELSSSFSFFLATTVDEIMQYVDRHRKHELNEQWLLNGFRFAMWHSYCFVSIYVCVCYCIRYLCSPSLPAAVLFVFVICTCLSQTLSHDVEWFPSNKLNWTELISEFEKFDRTWPQLILKAQGHKNCTKVNSIWNLPTIQILLS